MKILLTGSEGYIGAIVGPALVEAGYNVTGLDSCLYTSQAFIPLPKSTPPFVQKDIRNVTVNDFENIDAVVHLAELSNDPTNVLSESLTRQINVDGTLHLAETAKKAGVRQFIYLSSCTVYGQAGTDMVGEDSLSNPITIYAHCKATVEDTLASMANNTFMPVMLRSASVFGVSPRIRMDLDVNTLTGDAFTTGHINVNGDGSQWRPLIHIQDVANAIRAVLTTFQQGKGASLSGHNINLGHPELNIQIKDIAEAIQKACPEASIRYGAADPDARSYRVNYAKMAQLLPEFTPQWGLKKGITELLDTYTSIGLTEETFESRHFTRLKQLKYLMKNGLVTANSLHWQSQYLPL